MGTQGLFTRKVTLVRWLFTSLLCIWAMQAQAGWRESLDGLLKGKGTQPSAEQMSNALREALDKGVTHAVSILGVRDGFLGNPTARIPLPQELHTADKWLRKLGQSRQADEFVVTLNRAAEQAVPVSREIFIESIRRMTISDVKNIIQGPEDAGTQFFRKTGEPTLRQRFLPIIQQATQQVGATRAYKRLQQDTRKIIPFVKVNWVDLDTYVMDHALNALFAAIAAEERRIRKDPVARTTSLLKQVFGWAAQRH
jgi:hypothetical protein